MALEAKVNGYYRTVLSSINERNTRETNLLLLKEVIEASPKLTKSACEIIYSGQIAKCFYTIPAMDGTRQHLIMRGYCSCKLMSDDSRCTGIMLPLGYQYAENVLVRSSAFTCKHELACIIIEYMGSEITNNAQALLHSVEELEEDEYLERMHLVFDI